MNNLWPWKTFLHHSISTNQLPRHPVTFRNVFTGSRLLSPSSSSSTSNLSSSAKREPLQDGPRKTREQVYAKRNRVLLMYSSAVVRYFIQFYLASERWLKSYNHVDNSSDWRLLCSSSIIPYVLCCNWFCRNTESRHRSIRTTQTRSSRERPPDKSLFQCRSFWSASLVISSPAEVCERSSGRVKFGVLYCKEYVRQRHHWNCNL